MEGYFDQYEYVSLIVPGAVALGWYAVRSGEVSNLRGLKDISLGGFGALVVLAYLVGHLVAVVGAGIEAACHLMGGFPSDRIISEKKDPYFNEDAMKQINANIKKVLKGRAVLLDDKMSDEDRHVLRRQIYDAVAAANQARYVDTFNRTYGFLRNLTGTFLICAALSLLTFRAAEKFRPLPTRLWIFAGFLAVAIGTFWRMTEFSWAYSRELFIQFMRL